MGAAKYKQLIEHGSGGQNLSPVTRDVSGLGTYAEQVAEEDFNYETASSSTTLDCGSAGRLTLRGPASGISVLGGPSSWVLE